MISKKNKKRMNTGGRIVSNSNPNEKLLNDVMNVLKRVESQGLRITNNGKSDPNTLNAVVDLINTIPKDKMINRANVRPNLSLPFSKPSGGNNNPVTRNLDVEPTDLTIGSYQECEYLYAYEAEDDGIDMENYLLLQALMDDCGRCVGNSTVFTWDNIILPDDVVNPIGHLDYCGMCYGGWISLQNLALHNPISNGSILETWNDHFLSSVDYNHGVYGDAGNWNRSQYYSDVCTELGCPENSDNRGCGCAEDEPQMYYLNQDADDMNQNEDGIYEWNQVSEMGVTEGSGEQFCPDHGYWPDEITTPIVPTTSIGPYQPLNYVFCGDDFDDELGNPNSICMYDEADKFAGGGSTIGCTDPNATVCTNIEYRDDLAPPQEGVYPEGCYNPFALLDDGSCTYDVYDITWISGPGQFTIVEGDITFRVDFDTYLPLQSLATDSFGYTYYVVVGDKEYPLYKVPEVAPLFGDGDDEYEPEVGDLAFHPFVYKNTFYQNRVSSPMLYSPGELVSYRYEVRSSDRETLVYTDNIERNIRIEKDKPTFVNYDNIDVFYNYYDDFDSSLLPILKITDSSGGTSDSSGTLYINNNKYGEFNFIDELGVPIEWSAGNGLFSSTLPNDKKTHKLQFINRQKEILDLYGRVFEFHPIMIDGIEYKDKTYIRDVFINSLWKDMSDTHEDHFPPIQQLRLDAGREYITKHIYSSLDFVLFNLVINDEYRGVYLLKVEPDRYSLGLEKPAIQNMVINEFAAKGTTETDPDFNEDGDWVEFYNNSIAEINLSDGTWKISDDYPGEFDDYIIIPTPICDTVCLGGPNKDVACSGDGDCHYKVGVGGYITAWYDGNYDDCFENNNWICKDIHHKAKLGASGDEIAIFNNNNLIDHVKFGKVSSYSVGRCEDAGPHFIKYIGDNISYNSANEDDCPNMIWVEDSKSEFLTNSDLGDNNSTDITIINNIITNVVENGIMDNLYEKSFIDFFLLSQLSMTNGIRNNLLYKPFNTTTDKLYIINPSDMSNILDIFEQDYCPFYGINNFEDYNYSNVFDSSINQYNGWVMPETNVLGSIYEEIFINDIIEDEVGSIDVICDGNENICLTLEPTGSENEYNLNYTSNSVILGWQFNHTDCVVTATGGDSESNGFLVQVSDTGVLGVSLMGGSIPAGSGTLTILNGETINTGCLSEFVFTDASGSSLDVTFQASVETIFSSKYPEFIENMIVRWNELRASDELLNVENLMLKIDYYYDYIKNSVYYDNLRWRDYDRMETHQEIIDSYKDWIQKRIMWIDHNLSRIRYQLSQQDNCNFEGLDEYCNDPENTINFNSNSNINDGNCEYIVDKEIIIEVSTRYVNFPPVEKVELHIAEYNGSEVEIKYDMIEEDENIWRYRIPVFENGDTFKYRFVKIVPQVYNVITGPIEEDKLKTINVVDQHNIYVKHTFNEFVETFEESILPIVRVDTINYNDGGFTDDLSNYITDKPWYCPGFVDPLTNQIQDDEFLLDYYCTYGVNEIDDGSDYCEGGIYGYRFCSTRIDDDDNLDLNGYFETKESCDILCSVDCTDGENIWDEPKNTAYMEIIYNGEGSINNINDKPQTNTRIGIEVRGFSHRGFPKKQYAVETQLSGTPQCENENANYSLFCNGFSPEEGTDYGDECIFNNDNDFVILGPYRDRTFIRNSLAYDLWLQMGKTREYDQDVGIRTKHIEFVLNGVYQGIFVFMERVKINTYRIPINTTVLDEDTGGFILKVESGGEQNYFVGDDGYTKFEWYDPDYKDFQSLILDEKITSEEFDTKRTIMRRKVNDLERLTVPDQNFDLSSFSDYWLMEEFARNNEGFTRSQYWYTYGNYDSTGNPNKFYMGPVWDFNHSFGATIKSTAGWATQTFFAIPQIWSKMVYDFSADDDFLFHHSEQFRQRLWERWQLLKNEVLSIENIFSYIDEISNYFINYNIIDREHSRWYLSELQNYERDINLFKEWVLERYAWVDGHICCGELSDGELTDMNGAIQNPYSYDSTTDTFDCGTNNTLSNTVGIFSDHRFPSELNHTFVGNCYHQGRRNHLTTDDGTDLTEYPDASVINSFIHIYTPISEQKYSVVDTKSINFKWVYSGDIALYLGKEIYCTDEGYQGSCVDVGDVCGAGECILNPTINEWIPDLLIKFVIRDKFTRQVVHEFDSSEKEYEWIIADLPDIGGTYELIGVYTRKKEIPTGLFDEDENELMRIIEDNYTSNIITFSIESISIVRGCTDITAVNFDQYAKEDDGSCKYIQDCDEKYEEERLEAENIRQVNVNIGFNIISYPYTFAASNLEFFEVLNESYEANDGGGFTNGDTIMTTFGGETYSATYMIDDVVDIGWQSTNSRGFDLNRTEAGMGFVLKVSKPGLIRWRIPEED